MAEPCEKPTTVAMIVDDGIEVTIASVDARRPDLGLVEALMRLRLVARRRGWQLVVRDLPDEQRGLLDLVGLTDLLVLEPGRQPELGEQLGVDEVVQPTDPPV